MSKLLHKNNAEYRTSEFANQFCLVARIPIGVIGCYRGADRKFTEIWFGGDCAANDERRADLIRAAEVRLATFCSLSTGGLFETAMISVPDRSGDILTLMKEQGYLIGIGEPVDDIYPVIVVEHSEVGDRRAWRALMQIGMKFVSQQLIHQTQDRSFISDCLLETALEILAVEFFVVNAKGRIFFDGRRDGSLPSISSEWMVCNGRLSLRKKSAQADFGKAIRLATSEKRERSMFSVFSPAGAAKLVAVAPLAETNPPLAVVLFGRTEIDHTNLQDQFFNAYGLTRSERLIATEILGGRSIAEAADETHLSPATVRSYLKSVLSKTATHRQSEFISLYFTSILPVTSSIESDV